MDNKVLIGFVAVLVAFLGFPVVMNKVNQGKTATTVAPVAASVPANSSVPSELLQPPLLNEQNLINSEWQITVEKYKIKVTLAAGGAVYGTHPMAKTLTGMDYLEGRWRVEYDKLYVSTNFGGNEYNVKLHISGMNVYFIDEKGRPDQIQRFR